MGTNKIRALYAIPDAVSFADAYDGFCYRATHQRVDLMAVMQSVEMLSMKRLIQQLLRNIAAILCEFLQDGFM